MKRGTLLLGLLAAGTAIGIFWPGTGRTFVLHEVPRGKSALQLARELKSKGVLNTIYPFVFWTKVRGAEGRIKVGQYRFPNGRSAFWIVDDLVGGRTEKVRVVIPEGFASWQIAERLSEAGVCDSDQFRKVVLEQKLEGFLFPATYELDMGLEAAQVAQLFKRKFQDQWSTEMEARAQELKMTQHEILTLASIIEREVVVHDEAPLVSAVYHNRLKKRMKLEADPTVQFAMGYWKQRLLHKDLKNTKSPYNTYLEFGLPPGPICSPGLNSLKAALWPAVSDALFFVAGEGGRHIFSKNYRDHANQVNLRNQSLKRKSKK